MTIAPSYPLLAKYQPDVFKLSYAGGTMKAIWDNRRALDLLDSMREARHGAYGAIGHSLGGHNSVFTALFDQRIKGIVTSCGFDSFRDYYGGDPKNWEHGGALLGSLHARLAKYRGRLERSFDSTTCRGVRTAPHLRERAAERLQFPMAAREVYALLGARTRCGRASRLSATFPSARALRFSKGC